MRNFFFLQGATLALGLLFVGLAPCNLHAQEKGRTKSGLEYQFFEQYPEAAAMDSGAIGMMSMRQVLVANGDTVMDQSPEEQLPVQAVVPAEDPAMEGFLMMHEGDSATFQCLAKQVFGDRMPPSLPDSATAVFYVKAHKVFASAMEYKAYLAEKAAAQTREEAKIIESYIADKGWEDQKTDSGLYYVVEEEGNGEMPQKGDRIVVHYTGTLLDGTKFDSSVDRGQPFTFNVGNGRVIKGWDEGFMLFSPGAKGKLIVPSSLAYGAKAMGDKIKPYSVLVFDIEFLENISAEE